MAEKKKYQIKIQGQLVPVTEEVYLTYYRMKRRERHLKEQDAKHGVFHYSALDTKDTNGEDGIPDLTSPRIEDYVMNKLIAEKLSHCIAQLTEEEQELIQALFFRAISERQLSAETGLHHMTIHDRKIKILGKLKKLMKK
ncbi:sigma-70 family RNA polymerase sigma factor [Aminipila sp.]|uniref:sigma-70 family RNA polymerase sigma factor n=1 Tax=Aminipila sp. TaxID=2060095 RepID=UPI002896C481|nr:sigma-70 family RNA polymerase sigma factor [Aminipila sp.]